MKKFKAPLSGEVLGAIADSFQLSTVPSVDFMNEMLQERTPRKYLRGKYVKDRSAQDIIGAIASGLVAAGLFPKSVPDAVVLLTRVLQRHARQWDVIAGHLALTAPELERPALAALPYMRLAVIDLALRLASLACFDDEPMPKPTNPPWAEENGGSKLLRKLMRMCRKGMTRDRLAEVLSKETGRDGGLYSTVDRWLAKVNPDRPTQKHLAILARIFAKEFPRQPEARLLRALRLHYGLCDLCDGLAAHVGRPMVRNLAAALVAYIHQARTAMNESRLPSKQLKKYHLASVAFGSAYDSNRPILRRLWQKETLPAWKADLAAACGGIIQWKSRIEYCVGALVPAELLVPILHKQRPNEKKEKIINMALMLMWSQPEDLPPEIQAHIRKREAENPAAASLDLYQRGLAAAAAEDHERAAELFRLAAAQDASSMSAHYNHAVALTNLGRHGEALEAARTAAALDPGDDHPTVLVGSIMLELGRVQDALDHLESAAGGLQRKTAHYTYHLGVARLRADRVDAAIEALETAEKIEPDHPYALDLLAQCHLRLGDRGRARRYAKRAHHVGRSTTWNKLAGKRTSQ